MLWARPVLGSTWSDKCIICSGSQGKSTTVFTKAAHETNLLGNCVLYIGRKEEETISSSKHILLPLPKSSTPKTKILSLWGMFGPPWLLIQARHKATKPLSGLQSGPDTQWPHIALDRGWWPYTKCHHDIRYIWLNFCKSVLLVFLNCLPNNASDLRRRYKHEHN